MSRRLMLWGAGGALVLGALGAALLYWRTATERAVLHRTFQAAVQAADSGRWGTARALLEEQAHRHGRPTEAQLAELWRRLEFRVAGGLKDFATIEALARMDPKLSESDEPTALWLWRLRQAAHDEAGAEMVRAYWRATGRDQVGWLCAEVDTLVSHRQSAAARKLLASLPTTGPADVPLVLRRAMLATDQAELTTAFNQAYQLDPKNADLRAMRATVLESVGQYGYARIDYVAALLADPNNPLRRDDLASFYLRQGNLLDAVTTWREGLSSTSPDFMWERALFWGRILGVSPPAPALLGASRQGSFAGLLARLPADRYWDEAGYEKLCLPAAHAQREPAVTWLRILEFVRHADLQNAQAALNQAPRVASQAAPALHAALRLTLAVKFGAKPEQTGIAWPVRPGTGHRWWDVMGGALQGDPAASREVAAIAAGPHGVTAALLAAGWMGPACRLADWPRALQPDTPLWLQYGLLQSKRMVEGPAPALQWARDLPAVPLIDLLRSEMQLGTARAPEAVKTLTRLATLPEDTGYAAAWRIATWQLEQGKPLEAERIVAHSPPLHASRLGAEILARCALAQGNKTAAQKLYESIADHSLEAGAFLAREAYAGRDWARARKITEYWISQLPDNLELRANLAAIARAERAKARP